MIKKLIKIILLFTVILTVGVAYLSVFGVKTKKFNQKIKNEITTVNKKLDFKLNEVKFILNPINFSINVKTFGTNIVVDNHSIELESVKTKISLKSLLIKEFSIDNLQISTKRVKLKDIILLTRSFKNSPELFLLNKIIKDGYLIADINLNFDINGKIKDDYKIKGFIKNGKLDVLNRIELKNLSLFFQLTEKKLFLEEINTVINDFKISSAKLNIKEKKNLFEVSGNFLTDKKNDYLQLLKELNMTYLQKLDIKNIDIQSNNNFSFTINKKLKIKNLIIKSEIDLGLLKYKNNKLNIRKYFPDFKELIEFKNHKIFFKYNNDQLEINGKGNLFIEKKLEKLSYKINKKNNEFSFDTNLDISKNQILIDIFDYKKKKNLKSTISLKGIYKKNKKIEFNSILFIENNNQFLIKNLILNKDFKVTNLDLVDFSFINLNKIKNQITLLKKNNNYQLQGSSYDATKIINLIFKESSGKSFSNFLENFNTNLKIDIDKVFLDNEYSVNSFKGEIFLVKSEIDKLSVFASFDKDKKLTITINNRDNEKITTLFSDYARPFVKRYKFIKGFEEGSLDFNSTKKNNTTSGILKIYSFKLQELPALTKLLTLASLQGIADLLSGEGIRFNDFEMRFINKDKLMTIEEIYAIGPAISILMDGYIETDKLVSLRGTLVPATTINKAIGSIPILGDILVGKKTGEGVFGVSFKIKGPPNKLKTTVNPVKTLTPRFITRTLEKIKKD